MKDLLTNLRSLWAGLPRQRQIMLGVVGSAILIALTCVVFFANRPNMMVLFANMPPEEAARVVEFVKEKKIPFELSNDGKTVKVPDSMVPDLRLQLVQAGIPRKTDTAGGIGYELLDKPTFGMSDYMQKANFMRAQEGELARTIKALDAVDEASVHIVTPEEHIFSKERRQAKAAVLISLKPGKEVGPREVKVIQDLVANSVEGLDTSHVSVADTTGRQLSEQDDMSGISGLSSAQMKAEKDLEKYYQEQVQELLDPALGFNQSKVSVHAELDFDSVSQTSETFNPKTATPTVETILTEKTSSKTDAINGVAGEKNNTEVRSSQEPGASTSSTSEKNNETRNFSIDRTVETRGKAGPVIKRLTVAVLVNVRKSGTGAGATVQVRTPQEIAELEKLIKQAVGFTEGPARQDQISVQETAFAPAFEKEEVVVEPKTLGVPNSLLPFVSQACLVLLAVLLFFYLRSILKSTAEGEGDSAGEFASLLGRYKKIADDAMAEANRDKAPPTFLNADELSKLIRDNPSNTSQAIRVWLSRN